MKITVQQLRSLLNQQKELVIDKLASGGSYYNSENTQGMSKSLPIDKGLFYELGMKAPFPKDLEILEKYSVE